MPSILHYMSLAVLQAAFKPNLHCCKNISVNFSRGRPFLMWCFCEKLRPAQLFGQHSLMSRSSCQAHLSVIQYDHVDASCFLFVFFVSWDRRECQDPKIPSRKFQCSWSVLWFDKYQPFLFTHMRLCILTIHGTFSSADTAEGGLFRNQVYIYALGHVFPK